MRSATCTLFPQSIRRIKLSDVLRSRSASHGPKKIDVDLVWRVKKYSHWPVLEKEIMNGKRTASVVRAASLVNAVKMTGICEWALSNTARTTQNARGVKRPSALNVKRCCVKCNSSANN